MKRAFSLIELILVMVILSIVASIGTDIIRSLFDNYATTARVQNLSMQANNTADIIANRLEHRIAHTTAAINGNAYIPLKEQEQEGSLIFYRHAYELERNYATYKKTNVTIGDMYGGYIAFDYKQEQQTNNYAVLIFDNINSIDLSEYAIFFKNETDYSSNFYNQSYVCNTNIRSFIPMGSVSMQQVVCKYNPFSGSNQQIQILLSNEINRIRHDASSKKLYLDICTKDDSKCTSKKEYLLSDNVSDFSFKAIKTNSNINKAIVFKVCLTLGNTSKPDARVCQKRVVR